MRRAIGFETELRGEWSLNGGWKFNWIIGPGADGSGLLSVCGRSDGVVSLTQFWPLASDSSVGKDASVWPNRGCIFAVEWWNWSRISIAWWWWCSFVPLPLLPHPPPNRVKQFFSHSSLLPSPLATVRSTFSLLSMYWGLRNYRRGSFTNYFLLLPAEVLMMLWWCGTV